MFGIFNKKEKTINLASPMTGKALPVTQAPDPVFADKILGDGVAIDPTDGKVLAPVDGVIAQVAHTFHALGIETEDGLELLIHIGLDTVKLGGEGFICHVEVGQKVAQGDLLMEVDLNLIREKGLSIISPFILTNQDVVKKAEYLPNDRVQAGETVVIRCEK